MDEVLRVLWVGVTQKTRMQAEEALHQEGILIQSTPCLDTEELFWLLQDPWDLIACGGGDSLIEEFVTIKEEMEARHLWMAFSDGPAADPRWMRAGAADSFSLEGLARFPMALLRELKHRQKHQSARRALEEQGEHHRILMQTSGAASLRWDLQTHTVAWSPLLESFLGYKSGELGANHQDLLSCVLPVDLKRIKETLHRVLKLRGRSFKADFRALRADGDMVWLEGSARILRTEEGPVCLLAVIRDVTAERAREEAILHSQKTEAVGKLVAGIVHDFNNLLTVMLTYAQMAEQEAEDDALVEETIVPIRNAAERAAALTRQLLVFSRKESISPVAMSANKAISNITRMLRRIVGEDVQLGLSLEPELWPVWIDPGQCEQILVNLVVNARDAMPSGGVLSVSSFNLSLNEASPEHPGVPEGDWVLLQVRDTGEGVGEDFAAKIFEPYFTTKELGQGTGLGLAICQTIVLHAQGHIRLKSELGQGSTFSIYLPRFWGQAASDCDLTGRGDLQMGQETILLVEDEDIVRSTTARTLRALGYKVLEAPDGFAALETLERSRGAVDLLLTDVVMPSMSGVELCQEARSLYRDLNVLYTSAYRGNTIKSYDLEPEALLPKPFTVTQLAKSVRAALQC